MEGIRALWRPRGQITIPQYKSGGREDNVDLQVKALMYMFRRLRLAGDLAKPDPMWESLSMADRDNLDKMYNLPEFKRVLSADPHRVLVDWARNRYRLMLILSHHPQMEHFPRFAEPHFHFVVLESDASTDEYVRTLSKSDIYIEHPLPMDVRLEIATNAVARNPPPPGEVTRTKETRAAILLEYLRRVAVEIQVARIYKAMLAKLPKHVPTTLNLSSQSSPPGRISRSTVPNPSSNGHVAPVSARSPSHSPERAPVPEKSPQRGNRFPDKRRLQQDTPKLKVPTGFSNQHVSHSNSSTPPSPTNAPHSPVSPTNPPRLRLRASRSNIRLNEKIPNLCEPRELTPTLDAGRKHLLQQARVAVNARIDREVQALRIEFGQV